jgi:hypothetical protein
MIKQDNMLCVKNILLCEFQKLVLCISFKNVAEYNRHVEAHVRVQPSTSDYDSICIVRQQRPYGDVGYNTALLWHPYYQLTAVQAHSSGYICSM